MKFKETLLGIAIMFAGCGMLVSCGENNVHIDNSWNNGSLTVSADVVLDGATSQTINIKATEKPKLICEASWLKIGEVKSLTTGIYTTEITAEVNATGERREAIITVVSGKETATITVVQLFSDIIEVKSMDPEGELNADGGLLTIVYVATGTPAVNLPEWIGLADTRSLNEGELLLSYRPNDTGKEREGIIVLAVGKTVTNVTLRQPSR